VFKKNANIFVENGRKSPKIGIITLTLGHPDRLRQEPKIEPFFSRLLTHTGEQGCQIVSFQTKNPNLGKFWRALD
jgi:hypothetical protein